MNSQLSRVLNSLLCTLVHVRCAAVGTRSAQIWGEFGVAQGQIRTLRELGLITLGQQWLLNDLLSNASEHSGKPFPAARNVGPVMPCWIAFERRQAAVKPSARVLADERPSEVSAPASRPELRLLCLLVKDRDGKARSLPVHTMRPMPPRVLRTGRWSLASDPAFELRETHAVRPTTEVLERCARQRQAHALRPAARAFSAGGVSHVA